jgi:hypothetical protein
MRQVWPAPIARRRLLALAPALAAGAALLAAPAAPRAQPAQPAQPADGAHPLGQGPGFHDPRSAFAPLAEREGVVSWRLLTAVTTRVRGNRVVPTFPEGVRALDGRTVRIEGFMLPLEPGRPQRHFLLSAVPTTCPFCVPAGPEGLVEVFASTPVRYTVNAITVEGRFRALTQDRYGLFYRLDDAAEAR